MRCHGPRPADASPGRVLRLTGDTDGFDNTLYLATEPRDDATVFYVGSNGPDVLAIKRAIIAEGLGGGIVLTEFMGGEAVKSLKAFQKAG